MAINDFRQIYNEAKKYTSGEVWSPAEIELELETIFSKYGAIVEVLPGTKRYPNNIVVNLTASKNIVVDDMATGFTNGRFNMEIVLKLLKKMGEFSFETLEPLKLSFFKWNALRLKSKEENGFYITTFKYSNDMRKTTTIVTEKPIIFRGHGIAAAIRAVNTPFQEAAQAISILQTAMASGNGLSLENLSSVFHFKVYEIPELRNLLLSNYNNDADPKFGQQIYQRTGNAAMKITNLNNMVHLCDLGNDIVNYNGNTYSVNGIGKDIREAFYGLKLGFKNINSYFPADIIAYKDPNKIKIMLANVETAEDFNKIFENGQAIAISLKQNTSRTRISSGAETNNSKQVEVNWWKCSVSGGEIIVHVNFKHGTKNEEVNITFKTFGDDTKASFDTKFKNWKTTEIETSSVNASVNTETVIGKATDGFRYFLSKQKLGYAFNYLNIEPTSAMFESLFVKLSKKSNGTTLIPELSGVVKILNAENAKLYTSKFNSLIKVKSIAQLYLAWLNGLAESTFSVEDYLTYTIMASMKENYGLMNYFPKVYKIS